MANNLPAHIVKIINAIERREPIEKVLQQSLSLLSRDFSLVNIYLHLGYHLQTNTFATKPTAQQVLSLIQSEYGISLESPNIDTYFANSSKKPKDIHHELR